MIYNVCVVLYLVFCSALVFMCVVFFFKQKTAYEMRIRDWSSDVCSSDPHRLRQHSLQVAIERDDGERHFHRHEILDDERTDPLAHALYELVRPDIGRGDIYHRFADAPEILERNALGQQRTAGSCDGGQRQWLRRQAIYKLRRLFLQRVEKLPRLVHAEHLRRIKRDQMVEVRRNDRWRIDDCIARDHGFAAHVLGNPDRIQPEGRVLRFAARNFIFQIATVERQQILRPDLILAHDHARNGDTVAIRFKRQIILHADHRHDEAQFARQLPPDAGNASHERRALAIIDKTDKAIANLKPQRRAIGNIFPVDLRGVLHFWRSEEHTSELQSLMRISYAVFCLKKKNQ